MNGPSPVPQEFNFDGIVGLTHNYAGLSFGNLASAHHKNQVSQPKLAALQGLEKMKRLHDLGIPQAILPPHLRPSIQIFNQLGFSGQKIGPILDQIAKIAPELLPIAYSASNMWTANAATVSPSADTKDHKLHLTPANLISQLHRSFESEETYETLLGIFKDPKHFEVHPPIHSAIDLRDEGAANHIRLCPDFSTTGLHIFVHGDYPQSPIVNRFPVRQTRLAFSTIAKSHQLNPDHCLFIQQNPNAIDSGVFHNDVISVGHQNILFAHEMAFANGYHDFALIQETYQRIFEKDLNLIVVKNNDIPLDISVKSYLFNSQIVTLPNQQKLLLCPSECQEITLVKNYLDNLTSATNSPIQHWEAINLKQSMQNGGGPACLRLRVLLTQKEKNAINPNIFFSDTLYENLKSWINQYYPDTLTHKDLTDPQLFQQSQSAHHKLHSEIIKTPDPMTAELSD